MALAEKKKKKVLLIDDDEFLLDMYATKFRERGFEMDLARGAKEALQKLQEGHFDIILLDIVMPQVDGLAFFKEAKEKNLLKETAVLILSNLGQKEDIEKGMRLGAVDYIVKANFTPTEVVDKVESLLYES
jgi:DNA-binding response OmpR family regulator